MEHYRGEVGRGTVHADPDQAHAVQHLERLHQALVQRHRPPRPGLLRRLTRGFGAGPAQTPITGLYLWGGVGRGKTFLVDMFYDCLPFNDKKRIHFHRFMRKIHDELKQLRDQENPLRLIGQRFADQFRLICLDEFFVIDIGDAMILSGLLRSLTDHQVTLVATSNIPPDDLYKGGLQRDRFEPAIELLKTCNNIVHLGGEIDYRLEFLDKAETYFYPLGSAAERGLAYNFEHIAPEAGRAGVALEIEGRSISTLRHADGVAWFEFEDICGGPRSQNDYLEIARCFHTILIGNIPMLDAETDDRTRRFINLVDVFYDRNVKLIVSATQPPDQLYTGKRLTDEFKRTASRLIEMQSHDYLARPHLA